MQKNGRIDPKTFRSLIMNGKGRALVSLIFAVNNETGVFEDVARAGQSHSAGRRRRRGALLHVDAVLELLQPHPLRGMGRKIISRSPRTRLGGPQGVGALIARETAPLTPLFNGAQEVRRRAAHGKPLRYRRVRRCSASSCQRSDSTAIKLRDDFVRHSKLLAAHGA